MRKAAKSAVCKINIDSDSRLAMTAAIRKVFAEKPAEFDPRKYLGPLVTTWKKMTCIRSSTCLVQTLNWLNNPRDFRLNRRLLLKKGSLFRAQ